MEAIEKTIRATLAPYPEVRLAILFGSLALDRGRYDSDVDLAVDAGQPLENKKKMAMMEELAEHIGRPVDLVDLQTIGEPLLGQILKYGKRMLGTDHLYAELIKRHVFDEADFMPYLHLKGAVGRVGVGVDLLLLSEQEFERRSQVPGTTAYWAKKEGKVLYDAAA